MFPFNYYGKIIKKENEKFLKTTVDKYGLDGPYVSKAILEAFRNNNMLQVF